jgi:hypothetical protein
MSRRSTKRFQYGEGVYYFNINKGYNNNITLKRMTLDKALDAYQQYIRTHGQSVEWLGKWNGKSFDENNIEELLSAKEAS